MVGIEDGVIIGVDKLRAVSLRHLHLGTYRCKLLELAGVSLVVLGAMTGAGMDNNQGLILIACHNLLGKASNKSSIIGAIYTIAFTKLLTLINLVDMQWRLTPVTCAPDDIHAVSKR